jgi:hypothetical protein
MMHVLLWFVIVAAYFLSIVLICKCLNLVNRRHTKSTSPMNERPWTDRAVPGTTELPE